MAEKRIHGIDRNNRQFDSSIPRVSISHNNDSSNRPQYRKIQFNEILRNTTQVPLADFDKL